MDALLKSHVLLVPNSMVRWSLLVLVLLHTTGLMALPNSLLKALIITGQSDKVLKHFHQALSKHQLPVMLKLYKRGTEGLARLPRLIDNLMKLKFSPNTTEFRLKNILLIEMEILREQMTVVFGRRKVNAGR